jgi:hypothetical protein
MRLDVRHVEQHLVVRSRVGANPSIELQHRLQAAAWERHRPPDEHQIGVSLLERFERRDVPESGLWIREEEVRQDVGLGNAVGVIEVEADHVERIGGRQAVDALDEVGHFRVPAGIAAELDLPVPAVVFRPVDDLASGDLPVAGMRPSLEIGEAVHQAIQRIVDGEADRSPSHHQSKACGGLQLAVR